jgi:hypothetical protein
MSNLCGHELLFRAIGGYIYLTQKISCFINELYKNYNNFLLNNTRQPSITSSKYNLWVSVNSSNDDPIINITIKIKNNIEINMAKKGCELKNEKS